MKEATGELNMTVITLIAIAAIGALFYVFVWPMIQLTIANQTCKSYGNDFGAVRERVADQNGSATTYVYKCCPKTSDGSIDQGSNRCQKIEDDETTTE